MTQKLTALVQWYESLTPQTLAELPQYYADNASFKDPFNEVRGQEAISQIMGDMFRQLDAPRFAVLNRIEQGSQAFLSWDFHFRRAGKAWTIHGGSHLIFAEDGRVASHRDYWDAAEELYEKLPVLGFVLRRLKQMVKS